MDMGGFTWRAEATVTRPASACALSTFGRIGGRTAIGGFGWGAACEAGSRRASLAGESGCDGRRTSNKEPCGA